MRGSPSRTQAPSPVMRDDAARLRGGWLIVARAAWIVTTALVVGLDALGLPASFAQLLEPFPQGAAYTTTRLTTAQMQQLRAAGFSMSVYAVWILAVESLLVLVFVGVAAVIFWRRFDNRLAAFSSITLVLFGGTLGDHQYCGGSMCALVSLSPVFFIPIATLSFLASVCFPALFYLFPSGHWVPRWTRWMVVPWILYEGVTHFFPNASVNRGGVVDNLIFFPIVATTVLAQIYRYRLVSTPSERQQTKWIVFGFAMGVGGFVLTLAVLLSGLVLPISVEHHPLTLLISYTLTDLWLLLIPLSIAVAIVRSRLFDIDLLINRVLVYGSLTWLLALFYFASVIALQALVRGLTGQTSPLAIVVSTLAIAALFQPLRRGIQAGIDRRFYRRKYDAARTIAIFSATLQSEVDLGRLAEDLLAVVGETMQPEHLSLWLRPAHTVAGHHAPHTLSHK